MAELLIIGAIIGLLLLAALAGDEYSGTEPTVPPPGEERRCPTCGAWR
jgi:hypothetical protein